VPATYRPVDFFAFASSWQALAFDLGLPGAKKPDPDDDSYDDDNDKWATKVIKHVMQEHPGERVLIGFDAGTEQAALDQLRDLAAGAQFSIYVEGPGGPTGDGPNASNLADHDLRKWRSTDASTWKTDEAARVIKGAKKAEVGAAAGVDPGSLDPERQSDRTKFKKILDGWDNGKWWKYTKRQLHDYKGGYVAAEIDNISRALERFPNSFKAETGKTGLLSFFMVYAKAFTAGDVPALIMKNLGNDANDDNGDLIVAAKAVTDKVLPRDMFADFHIREVDEPLDESGIQKLSRSIGIETAFSRDTFHYRAKGAFSDKAGDGLKQVLQVAQDRDEPLANELPRIVHCAIDEFDRFGGVKEADEPLRSRIEQYYEAAGNPKLDPLDNPWSAAFISFCVKASGATSNQFAFSAQHSVYVFRAIKNQENDRGDFRGYRITEYSPKLGDIVQHNRPSGSIDFDEARQSADYESHAAIIVAFATLNGIRGVVTVGGNEGGAGPGTQTVGKKFFPVDVNGRLKDSSANPKLISVIENRLSRAGATGGDQGNTGRPLGRYRVNVRTYLKVRGFPSTNANESASRLSNGDVVTVVKFVEGVETGIWALVDLQGDGINDGYVLSDFIESA
jgi:hypothetical protein